MQKIHLVILAPDRATPDEIASSLANAASMAGEKITSAEYLTDLMGRAAGDGDLWAVKIEPIALV